MLKIAAIDTKGMGTTVAAAAVAAKETGGDRDEEEDGRTEMDQEQEGNKSRQALLCAHLRRYSKYVSHCHAPIHLV